MLSCLSEILAWVLLVSENQAVCSIIYRPLENTAREKGGYFHFVWKGQASSHLVSGAKTREIQWMLHPELLASEKAKCHHKVNKELNKYRLISIHEVKWSSVRCNKMGTNLWCFAHNITYLWLWVAGSTLVCGWKKSWIRMWFTGWLISACLCA